jgi:hypothetical protein
MSYLPFTNGGSLTRDESRASYAIIRHNVRTYESGGVVEIVKGKHNAETTVKQCEACQSSEDRQLGWRYFLELSTLKAGTDPAEATQLRQTDLDVRESQARHEPNSLS